MSKKPSRSRAVVPMGQSKRAKPAKATLPTVTEATTEALLPLLPSPVAVAKLIGSGGEVVREGRVTLVRGRTYATRDTIIPAEEVYYDPESKPKGSGPWVDEAEKIAWRDQASGYDCILLRNPHQGFLSGFVGVPSDHPLWGRDHSVLPSDLGIEVHGGLNYSALCEEARTSRVSLGREARRICHVPRSAVFSSHAAHPSNHEGDNPEAWWFGFSCNHTYDLIPAYGDRSNAFMTAETGQQYRDESYVVRETAILAAQLHAIARSEQVPAREGPGIPPLGLDPAKGGTA